MAFLEKKSLCVSVGFSDTLRLEVTSVKTRDAVQFVKRNRAKQNKSPLEENTERPRQPRIRHTGGKD